MMKKIYHLKSIIYHYFQLFLFSEYGYVVFQRISCLSRIDIEKHQSVSVFIFFRSFYNTFDISQFLHCSVFYFDAEFIKDKLRNFLYFIRIIKFSISFIRTDRNCFAFAYFHPNNSFIQSFNHLL